MFNKRNWNEEFVSTMINSVNKIQIKKIIIGLRSNDDEEKLRICRIFDDKISNFHTNNIVSNNVVIFIT